MVHWTQTTFDREQGWLTPELHHQFPELMFPQRCVKVSSAPFTV